MKEKICPIMVLAASIEGLKPILRQGNENKAECLNKRCAFYDNDRFQCAILTTAISIAGLDEGGIRALIDIGLIK